MKWEFVEDDKIAFPANIGPVILTRIRALEHRNSDGVNDEVNIGDLGGYIEREWNLSQNDRLSADMLQNSSRHYWNIPSGKAWVANGAYVFGHARVTGNAYLGPNVYLHDCAMLLDNAMVAGRRGGNANIGGTTRVMNNITIIGSVAATGNTMFYGNGIISNNSGELDLSDLRSLFLYDDIQITAYGGYSSDIRGDVVLGPGWRLSLKKTDLDYEQSSSGNIRIYGSNGFIIKSPA